MKLGDLNEHWAVNGKRYLRVGKHHYTLGPGDVNKFIACPVGRTDDPGFVTAKAEFPLPRGRQVAALHAVRDQWDREGWDFSDRRIAPDRSLADGDPGHLEAGTSFGDASVIGSANQDHLDVIVSSDCYDAVKGEDPGKG